MKVRFFILMILLSVAGCAINKGTVNSYVEPTYERGSIKTMAVFPIRNARLSPSEARRINKQIIQGLIRKNPNIKILSPSESLRKINNSNLAKEWASFIEDYFTSGIPNRQTLAKVAKHLSADAIMQGNILNVSQVDGDGWKVRAQARITVEFSIIETATAKTIWETSSDGIKRIGFGGIFETAPPIADALELAIGKITNNMPVL